ncbi:folylpolyglutamate synthase/dihydrofolate synthase [Acetivibrio clariflavus DSM 19732]|uniref:Dihydrofolate synthase/folylpolyglutamate synthase n=2 Tax=Acetivibrio clariflavus TaxID=288965 RepID=G8M1F8_ACECE|nr:folylpolyglutamate synthase/dihydrofolate synthase [Acetivibrio clariflavus DSM 19732]
MVITILYEIVFVSQSEILFKSVLKILLCCNVIKFVESQTKEQKGKTMNYIEALNYIHGTVKFGIKLGLENIKTLLELMGNPQEKLKFVHVAGTNGKGSTVAFISNVLIEAGYKVGIYTSPCLERFNERIKVNNEEIDGDDLARITTFVKEHVDIMISKYNIYPTEFEIVTAIAFEYFYEMNCDIVVLEVGLGGRFDATNVINEALVSVITTISYDHMDRLGDTLEKIAFEKAGIIKNKGDVVLFPQGRDILEVIEKVCEEKNANLHIADFESIRIKQYSIDGQKFEYNGKSFEISLLGEHQVKNAVVALAALKILRDKGYKIPDDSIERGLVNARWPGRFEVLSKKPVFLIDGAHNKEGAENLAGVLKSYFPGKKIIFIIGALRDKDVESIIRPTVPLALEYITVAPDSSRALSPKEMSDFVLRYCKRVSVSDTIEGAIRTSLNRISSEDDVICAYGSLYYIGKIRSFFKH